MVTNRVFWMGWNGYEPEMSTPFFQLAASARAAIDVGANIGYYSILAALANPSSMVVAIEPVTANLKRLSVNKCLSGTANLIIDATALGREIGRVRFRQEVGDKVGFRGGIALTYEDDPSRPDGEWETTEVPCTTVDALSHTRHISGLVDLIKMDVEGGEIDVLAGALQTLASTRPVIFSEILTMEAAREMKRILDPLGYQYFRLTDTGANEVVGDIERIQEWRNFMIVAPGGRLSSEAFALCAGA